MKRVLVVAMVVFVLALQVSTVSAGGIRVDPGGAVSLSAVNWDTNLSSVPADPGMGDSMTVQGGKATPVLFPAAAAEHTVTPDIIKPDPSITK